MRNSQTLIRAENIAYNRKRRYGNNRCKCATGDVEKGITT